MKEFLKEAIRQIFNISEPRKGELWLTHTAVQRMNEHKLNMDDIEDAFRRGIEQEKGLLVRSYKTYQVFIRVRADEYRENMFMVITCWRIG